MASKWTRRQLSAVLVTTPLLAQAPAAAPQSAPVQEPTDPLEKARLQIRKNAEQLDKVQLAMSVEPSFAFKP